MSGSSAIYTRKGDLGQTSLIGGQKVPKNHMRIEAYGTLDELNSFIGLLKDQIQLAGYTESLDRIQQEVFLLESYLALGDESTASALPAFPLDAIQRLEKEMDVMSETLPELQHFIIPGGHPLVSTAHIVRCITRRAERNTLHVAETYLVPDYILAYLNRLSDYFFVLARKLSHDLKSGEQLWNPRRS